MNQLYSIVYVLATPFRSRGGLLLLLLGLLAQPALAQTIRYVKPSSSGNGNGLSWSNATSNLLDAINASNPGDQVWVAAGLYKPGGATNTERSFSFLLRNGVAIYGGFVGDGSETSPDKRPATSPSSTTLSGNIGSSQSRTDNSYHVIRNSGSLSNGATLDGFVIADGQADGNGEEGYGGGLYNVVNPGLNATITLKNCQFINNYSRSTAGALLSYANNSGSAVVNCFGCTFDNNTAQFGGGAAFIGKNLFDAGNQRYFGNTASSQFNCDSCLFQNNRTTAFSPGEGGAIFLNNRADATISSFKRCRFLNNQAGTEGGAIYNLDGSPDFKNCGFVGNTGGAGGVLTTRHLIASTFAQPKFTNCSFTKNQHTEFGVGSVVHVQSRSRVHLINSIVSGNGNYANDESGSFYSDDTGVSSVTATASLFNNTVRNYTGSTSFTTTTSPFSDTATLEISPCSPALNASSPTFATPALIGDTDLNGKPRFFGGTAADIGAVEYQGIMQTPSGGSISLNGQSASTTLCVGTPSLTFVSTNNGFSIGAYRWEARINGSNSWLTLSGATNATAAVTSVTINAGQTTEFRRVAFGCNNTLYYSNTITARTFDPSLSAGGISGPPLVPVPQESSATLNSTSGATASHSLSISWQQSEGTDWTDLPNSNLQSIPLPTLETGTDLTVKTFYFRRKAQNGCASVAYSNTVVVTARDVTGQIEGKVMSGEGAVGVRGVLLTLRRLTNGLTGGLNNHSYTVLTGQDGAFVIPNVYWGFESGTQNSTVTQSQFVLTPSYGTHEFNPVSRPITMDKPRNVVLNQDFKDLSTYAISGKVEQHCTDCLPLNSDTPGNVYCALDSVDVYLISRVQNLTLATQSQKLNNKYGQWNHTLTFPGVVQVIPKYRHYVFAPVPPPSFNVENDVSDVNFTTTTSATIVGQLTAGCSDGTGIGRALLEFEDVPKKGASPNVCFRKRVTTDNNGNYYIVLPARQYIVKVISFTALAGSEVIATEVVDFFRDELARDSLTRQSYIRNVTSATAVTQLNLVYPRPARLAFSALPQSPVCGSTPRRTMLEQFKPTSLSVSVYQGAPARGCPFTSGTMVVAGSFFGDGSVPQKFIVDSTGLVSLTLVAGLPNLFAPHEWKLEVSYTDKYGRPTARKEETIVVTGVQSGTAMFTTVSPQLPYFVLHDPPGDGSYSFRQLNSSSQVSTRQYVTLAGAGEYWAEVKIGSKLLSGIGIAVPSEAYGTISGKIKVEGGDTRGNERVTTLTATTIVQTSSLPNFVGPEADVYYGAAENLYYSLGMEVLFDRDSCKFRTKKSLVMLHSGFAPNTDYAYTVGYIRNVIIPVLRNDLAALVDPSDESKRIYLRSQATVWEQLLKHHEENRRRAIYRKTVSVSGGATYSESSTSDTTATNTYDWSVAIDATVGAALGFEVAGSGASAGYSANFRTERGGSRVKGSGTSVTTGFSLTDDDPGDAVAFEVKDDAVYQTPLFEVLAGQTSCPPELATQPRDQVQFYAEQSIREDVPADGEAEFVLKLGNISSVLGNLDKARTYYLSFLQGSNPDGALVSLGNDGVIQSVPFQVNRGEETQMTIRVRKAPSSRVFSYENLQFIVSDSCGGNDLKTVSLSVHFKGECSNVTFRSPEPDWLATANVSVIPIHISGYTRSNLSRVALQYQAVGQSGWREAFSRTATDLNDGSSGTIADWNTAGLPDGIYSIRLELNCTLPGGAVGRVFSQTLRGRIDTTPPDRFGNTLPLTSTFVTGDVIGVVYDEPLGCSRIRLNGRALLAQASNGNSIPITVGCAANQIILTPIGSLAPFVGQMLSVTLSGISDVYGNVKPQPDSWKFYVGSAPPATGSQAVSVLAANSSGDKVTTSVSIREDATGTVDFTVQLPQPARNNIFVYFSLAGTARFGSDYTVSYLTPPSVAQPFSISAQPLSATITGNNGLVVIPRGGTSVRIKIDPVADPYFEPNETVIINLLNGGDYGLSAASSVTAIIENDDVQTNVITSVRNGYWEDPDTWDLARLPLTTDQVILDQNHTVTVSTIGIARKLTPKLNSRLRLLLPSSKLRLGF